MRDGSIQPATCTPTGVRIRGVCKSFGSTEVLHGVDLDIAPGELLAVLGVSGAGKTTLLRVLCGFESLDAGSIELGARPVAGSGIHVPPEQRGIGYVAQEGALFPHLDVARNILFGLPRKQRSAGHAEARARVNRLLALVGLPADYATRMPAALSGGEQQRVALARALAPCPALVLLDEPFSALDAGLRASTRAAVTASLKRIGATAILVTHDQDEALSTGDRIAVLRHGHLVQVAHPQELYRFPANPEVARFVGKAILVPGSLAEGGVDCRFGHLPLARGPIRGAATRVAAVEVMIRPEQIRPYAAESSFSRRTPGNTAEVVQLDYFGHDAEVTLRAGDGFRFTASISGMELPRIGDRIAFRVLGPVVVYPRAAGVDDANAPAAAAEPASGATGVDGLRPA